MRVKMNRTVSIFRITTDLVKAGHYCLSKCYTEPYHEILLLREQYSQYETDPYKRERQSDTNRVIHIDINDRAELS